jgi:hypothetical protein
MVCPVCKAEYREGFTRCADCDVALVDRIPDAGTADSFVPLWRGDEPEILTRLSEKLQSAGIEFAVTPLEVYLRRAGSLSARFEFALLQGFVVSVRLANLAEARGIRKGATGIGMEAEAFENRKPAEEENQKQSPEPSEWKPGGDTVEIWTGETWERAEFLLKSLEEVEVPGRIVADATKRISVVVPKAYEASGREILRQVMEGAAPEKPLPLPWDDVFSDEPVRTYLWAWLPCLLYFAIWALLQVIGAIHFHSTPMFSPIDTLFSVTDSIATIGLIWMIYQAVRYEISPWRFILLALLPFSFVWYYGERYARRSGIARYPVAVRMRMAGRPQ